MGKPAADFLCARRLAWGVPSAIAAEYDGFWTIRGCRRFRHSTTGKPKPPALKDIPHIPFDYPRTDFPAPEAAKQFAKEFKPSR